ncbi:MAG: DUF1292 domain-containing protein [Lachnospiraceae bacterium]|nr:DUF1292 domain-containing protein [Lachnospiraceae bacterium]MBO7631892.1 DUF1292 domain-containing protein [Lachnospiraceae bacterium]
MADYKENLDHDTVTLFLDNEEQVECDVIAIFPARDGEYIALAPQQEEGEAQVYLYRFKDNPDDETSPILENIEGDDEFDEVSEAFYEYMDENDYEDLDEELPDGE